MCILNLLVTLFLVLNGGIHSLNVFENQAHMEKWQGHLWTAYRPPAIRKQTLFLKNYLKKYLINVFRQFFPSTIKAYIHILWK